MRKILPIELLPENIHWLDFTAANIELATVDLVNTLKFSSYVFDQIPKGKVGIGGWLENRTIYRRSDHFQLENESRTFHLGLDIWTDAFTPIFAPCNGIVHCIQNNEGFGDYGPTIILKHTSSENGIYYSLYGHLSMACMRKISIGQEVNKGDEFAKIGNFPENGDWPPHLHFQLMKSLEGKMGDYPGVCSKNDLPHYKANCMNPMEFLGIKKEHRN